MRETSHDDTESSRLLANCHRTNDAFGCGGDRGDIARLALRLLKVKRLADYKWIAACAVPEMARPAKAFGRFQKRVNRGSVQPAFIRRVLNLRGRSLGGRHTKEFRHE